MRTWDAMNSRVPPYFPDNLRLKLAGGIKPLARLLHIKSRYTREIRTVTESFQWSVDLVSAVSLPQIVGTKSAADP
jgi:hypothetical protein